MNCWVCDGEVTGAHTCVKCGNYVHLICGTPSPSSEEGYGQTVTCSKCNTEQDQPKNANKTVKKLTMESWLGLKPKSSPTKKKSCKPSFKKRGICLTCYKNDADPSIYTLCRRDNYSLRRHNERRHKDGPPGVVKAFSSSDKAVGVARQRYLAHKEKVEESTVIDLPLQASSSAPTPKRIKRDENATQLKILDESSPGSSISVHDKLDEILGILKGSVIKSISQQPLAAGHGPLSSLNKKVTYDWSQITNLITMVDTLELIRFFPGDQTTGVPGCIRCEPCYDYLCHTTNRVPRENAVISSQKYANSLSGGLLLKAEKLEQLVRGSNEYWYGFKRSVKDHLSCADQSGDNAKLHFAALKYAEDQKRIKSRAKNVTENLVRIALTVVKTKSAAQHYETMIASHASTGSDVGELSHSRKQFPGILRAAGAWTDRQISMFLTESLPSTRLPPHFFVTLDKATPQRITNQAVLICPMVEGRREAIAVSSPVVYHGNEDATSSAVDGGSASQLAERAYNEIKNAFPSLGENVRNSWMGTVCDGAYQAGDFSETLKNLLDQEKYDDYFYAVLWDASHFIDLAISDVKTGKTGSAHSEQLLSLVDERASVIHRVFQRGKMLSQAKEMERFDNDYKLKMTSRPSKTRFATSHYVEYMKLLDSLPLYIDTFRRFAYSESKEYKIAGQDFVMDLCGVCDILSPVMKLLVQVQGLSTPCWKVLVWWPRVREILEDMYQAFTLRDPGPQFPLLQKHMPDISQNVYKGTKLVPGWMVVSTDTQTSENEKGKLQKVTVDNWRLREDEDVKADLKGFLRDLKDSLQKRMDACVNPMMSCLACLDLDIIINLLCGERDENGRVTLSAGEGQLEKYGRDEFRRFFSYVCDLEHVRTLDAEDNELNFDEELCHVVYRRIKMALRSYVWNNTNNCLANWFSLDCSQTLLKMEQVNDSTVLQNQYKLTFAEKQTPVISILNEIEVYRSIYVDETLYTAIGVEGCVAIDVGLAKGGPEAITESFYSVMTSQESSGGQSNETLALRTKLDWCLPPAHRANRAVSEIADLYLNGDVSASLPRHQLPILGGKAKFKGKGKVMLRLEKEEVRLPFLL